MARLSNIDDAMESFEEPRTKRGWTRRRKAALMLGGAAVVLVCGLLAIDAFVVKPMFAVEKKEVEEDDGLFTIDRGNAFAEKQRAQAPPRYIEAAAPTIARVAAQEQRRTEPERRRQEAERPTEKGSGDPPPVDPVETLRMQAMFAEPVAVYPSGPGVSSGGATGGPQLGCVLPAGSAISATLLTPVDTATGGVATASTTRPAGGGGCLAAGSTIVLAVGRARVGSTDRAYLEATAVVLPTGQEVPVSGQAFGPDGLPGLPGEVISRAASETALALGEEAIGIGGRMVTGRSLGRAGRAVSEAARDEFGRAPTIRVPAGMPITVVLAQGVQ